MRTRLTLVMVLALAALVPTTMFGATQQYANLGVFNGQDLGQTVYRQADGTVKKLINNHRIPQDGTPSEVADRFLAENASLLFGLSDVEKSVAGQYGDIRLTDVRVISSISGHHVWKQATVNGVPVNNGFVVVHMTLDNQVLFVDNELGSGRVQLNRAKASVSNTSALATAAGLIGGDGQTRVAPTAELVVYRDASGDRLAWRTETATYNPYGDWEIFIDAATGAEIVRKDRLVCIKPEEKPAFITPPVPQERSAGTLDKSAKVDGTGLVFINNPLNGQDSRYGWRDGDAILDTVRDAVTLRNLDGSGLLTGSWVEVFNSSGARANEPGLNYNYSSLTSGHFQEANVYYHIDWMQEYIQNDLGIPNMRNRVTDCYAHQGTDDNSDYSPSEDRIRYGDGGVDDSEDGEVVVHEYGHALHNEIVPGFVYAGETGAISEGFGDYIAATMGDNPIVAEWDATSYNPGPPPNLRRCDTDKHYPEDIVNQVHSDGEIISGAWYDLRNLIGQIAADQIIFEGMFYTGTSATFQDYADGVVAADQALNGGSNLGYIYQAFGGRGIGPSYLLEFTHTPLGDTEELVGPYAVVTTITHTSPISAPDAVKMHYRYGGAGAFSEVVLSPTGGFNEWGGDMPGPGMITSVEYYLTVVDDAGISGSLPTTAPADVMSFQVGPDAQFPVITHTPLTDKPLLVWPASVNAMITDNGTIASAVVSYTLNGVPQADLAMTDLGGDQFSATFPEPAGSLVIGDTFEYTITAVDASSSANTTVDGPHTFSIIDALGVVLILDDDNIGKEGIKYHDDTKELVPIHHRDPMSKGASADAMETILVNAGWVVVREDAETSDPASWSGYSLLIASSGANESPVASATFRSDIEAYVAAGGKLISEGGEVGYDAISFPGYPTYASNVVHGNDWDADNAGALGQVSGMEFHPILTTPNAVGPTLDITYSGYGDQDAFKVNDDAYIVMEPANNPGTAGIMVFDDNPHPASAQIVHYAFNFAAADPTEAAKILENTALFLITPEAPGTAQICGEVLVQGAGSNEGVVVTAMPGGATAVTGADGLYCLTDLYAGTYTVSASIPGYGTAPQVVTLVDGEIATDVNFGLGQVIDISYCDAPGTPIPDSTPEGVYETILVTDGDIVVDITCSVNITHTWKGDLIVALTSPAGTTVRMHNRSGSSTDDVIANYDLDTVPDGPGAMSDFDGESPLGFWTLWVSDNAGGDTGTINEWCVNLSVTDIVVANDMPTLASHQDNGPPTLSWQYNTATVDGFNVYRRVADGMRTKLNDEVLTSESGRIEFVDSAAQFDEGTILFYSIGLVMNGVEMGTGDEIELKFASSLPTVFTLHDNYPNPFNPMTNIKFDLPREGRVSLRIYDLSGRVVKTLVDEHLVRAVHEYQWDGTDSSGRRMASGTYYYRVQTDEIVETGKMMLVK